MEKENAELKRQLEERQKNKDIDFNKEKADRHKANQLNDVYVVIIITEKSSIEKR
ncbi:hypothetical protein [Megamonas hypermegale]|uniref:hypothetical protein n=1 Tax=Megamonas hypermegale TaxID=158847 RepID=UPI0026EB4EC4|nr:hypothetical protein [Megamonas hypermegale]